MYNYVFFLICNDIKSNYYCGSVALLFNKKKK